MLGHNNVMVRMQAAGAPAGAIPADTYLEERRRKSHNGDAIELFHMPNASTDGDSLVHFRSADVIVAGDIFTTTQYPFIDTKNGGTVQGLVRALNAILDRTVFRHQGEGGTYVVAGSRLPQRRTRGGRIPRHGGDRSRSRESDEGRRRITDADPGGQTDRDYDTRYGANTGPWTTAMFLQAVYDTWAPSRARA